MKFYSIARILFILGGFYFLSIGAYEIWYGRPLIAQNEFDRVWLTFLSTDIVNDFTTGRRWGWIYFLSGAALILTPLFFFRLKKHKK